MKKIVLANRNSYKDSLEEEKYLFLRYILLSMELPVEECMPENMNDQSIDHRIQLRNTIQKFGLFIKEPSQDTLHVFLNNEIIAKFNKPIFFLKEDLNEIDITKRKYLEIHFEYEHPFETGE